MPAHAFWKGHLKISLVSIPVRAYTASRAAGSVALHQLHAECHSRIKYVKTCPIHGEVSNDEIVSGYEYAKDQYVVVDPEELDKLRPESDQRSITVNAFIGADALDPIYHAGKSYYLLPDGQVGDKPYTLILRAMQTEKLNALAQVVLSSRERLVLVRPMGKLLGMTTLQHAAEIKEASEFEDEAPDAEFTKQEMQLAQQLMGALRAKKIDYSQYRDTYVERLSTLIEAKVKGEEVVTPPGEEAPLEVINLMDALKASVQKTAQKPQRKMAGSTRQRAAKKPARKRASG